MTIPRKLWERFSSPLRQAPACTEFRLGMVCDLWAEPCPVTIPRKLWERFSSPLRHGFRRATSTDCEIAPGNFWILICCAKHHPRGGRQFAPGWSIAGRPLGKPGDHRWNDTGRYPMAKRLPPNSKRLWLRGLPRAKLAVGPCRPRLWKTCGFSTGNGNFSLCFPQVCAKIMVYFYACF